MKSILLHLLQCSVLTALVLSAAAIADDPTHDAFTYQGQLRHNGDPVAGPVNLAFRLYDAAAAGSQIGLELESLDFDAFDEEGRFTIDLEFGKSVFDGTPLWLEVRINGAPLTPRQPIMPAPYSVRALTIAPTAAPFFWNGMNAVYSGGNVGIGTSAPLAPLHVQSGEGLSVIMPGLQLFQNLTSPNVIGGFSGNELGVGVIGATIGGGGQTAATNRITNDYGTVGGGANNAADFVSTVAGGLGNSATATGAAIGGGDSNTAGGPGSTIGGGSGNTAWATASTVGGGGLNSASGEFSTIPGGGFNNAQGNYSFAAGRRAKANHHGAFVWGDSTEADFASSGNNQFLIRASGGVGINTSNPAHVLHVRGSSPSILIENSGSAATFLRFRRSVDGPNDHYLAVGSTGQMVMRVGGQDRLVIRETGNVGIGTPAPTSMLHVVGAENDGTNAAVRIVSGDQAMLLDGNEVDALHATGLYLNNNVAHNVLLATGGGNVGIGTTAPAQRLSVNGTAGKPGGGSWSTFSDARLKKNIRPLTGSLDQLLALHGVEFEYLDPEAILELPGTRIGMIAQEVETVFPEWVRDLPNGYKSLAFSGFEALAVEALRDLRREKDAENALLRNEVNELRRIVEQLVRALEHATDR